jgi:hypothetical protein
MQRTEGTLHPTLRLWAVGADDWREQRTVTQNLTLHYDRMMLILEPTLLARSLVRSRLIMLRFVASESAFDYFRTTRRRVVDKRQQRTYSATVRAVDLHQFAHAVTPPTRLMRGGQAVSPIDPQPVRHHPLA